MTRQTKANLISTLFHGLIVAAILSLPQPEAVRKPALELDFHIMETQPALTSVPGPMAEAKAEVKAEEPVAAPPAPSPIPEEKREPSPVPPPAPEKPKKVTSKPKVWPAKPDPVPPPEPQAVATQPRESMPLGETAAGPAVDAGTPFSPPAASSLTAKGDHAAGPSASQAGPGPLRDVTFGQGSGPSFTKRILPAYPWQARRLGRQGKVLLRLHISARGTLENVEIVESGGLLFDEASLQAARASSYCPAMVEGIPVASTALLPIKFNLKNDDEGGG